MFEKPELTEVFCHFIQADLNGLVIGWVFRVFCEEPEVKLQNSIQGLCGTLTNDLAKDSVIWVFKWCGETGVEIVSGFLLQSYRCTLDIYSMQHFV